MPQASLDKSAQPFAVAASLSFSKSIFGAGKLQLLKLVSAFALRIFTYNFRLARSMSSNRDASRDFDRDSGRGPQLFIALKLRIRPPASLREGVLSSNSNSANVG